MSGQVVGHWKHVCLNKLVVLSRSTATREQPGKLVASVCDLENAGWVLISFLNIHQHVSCAAQVHRPVSGCLFLPVQLRGLAQHHCDACILRAPVRHSSTCGTVMIEALAGVHVSPSSPGPVVAAATRTLACAAEALLVQYQSPSCMSRGEDDQGWGGDLSCLHVAS